MNNYILLSAECNINEVRLLRVKTQTSLLVKSFTSFTCEVLLCNMKEC
ncbi:MAG: hypothetical protein FWD49_00925 [Firmicutes bacterium]|nr:hypothetical protein [Bacillota bacterium]